MSEQDTDVFKIFISQMGQCRHIDPVLGKALRILGHADGLEPVQDLLHRHTWNGSTATRSGNLAEKWLKTNEKSYSAGLQKSRCLSASNICNCLAELGPPVNRIFCVTDYVRLLP